TELGFQQSKERDPAQLAERLEPYLQSIVDLLVHVGINGEHIAVRKARTRKQRRQEATWKSAGSMGIKFHPRGFIQFGELVGYRYCCHKQARLGPVLAYMKMKDTANE